MAKPGQTIEAPLAGLRVTFHETDVSSDGETLAFDYEIAPGKGHIRPHIHVGQVEHYEIISGYGVYSQNNQPEKVAQPGDIITNLPDQRHVNPWNRDGKEPLVIRVTAHPSLGVEYFFETWFGLVRDERYINREHAEMLLLQNLLTLTALPTQTYAADLPLSLQKAVFPMLASVARMRGYQDLYADYVDIDEARGAFSRAKPLKDEHLMPRKSS